MSIACFVIIRIIFFHSAFFADERLTCTCEGSADCVSAFLAVELFSCCFRASCAVDLLDSHRLVSMSMVNLYHFCSVHYHDLLIIVSLFSFSVCTLCYPLVHRKSTQALASALWRRVQDKVDRLLRAVSVLLLVLRVNRQSPRHCGLEHCLKLADLANLLS